jgi:hypothetical protein
MASGGKGAARQEALGGQSAGATRANLVDQHLASALRDLQIARGTVHFPVLDAGAIAYELNGECANYLMCLEGRTRIFRISEGGREVLIYKVRCAGLRA